MTTAPTSQIRRQSAKPPRSASRKTSSATRRIRSAAALNAVTASPSTSDPTARPASASRAPAAPHRGAHRARVLRTPPPPRPGASPPPQPLPRAAQAPRGVEQPAQRLHPGPAQQGVLGPQPLQPAGGKAVEELPVARQPPEQLAGGKAHRVAEETLTEQGSGHMCPIRAWQVEGSGDLVAEQRMRA